VRDLMEETFQLVRNCGLTYTEVRSMDVARRRWWMERTREQVRKETEERERQQSSGKHPRGR